MQKLFIGVMLTVLLAACATDKDKAAANSGKPAPITEGSASSDSAKSSGLNSSSSSSSELGKNRSSASDSGSDANSMASRNAAESAGLMSKRSVYYPLDVYVVQDADKPIVQAHAQYLSTNADRKIRLEGNCDERGSTEYNLALGQRRADGVKQMLLIGGVKASQIDSVSFGEEKPKAEGHDEASWTQNRRTDLNYGS